MVIAGLVPGLVFAAPFQGPCGLCERGLPCADMEPGNREAAAHSCCGATDDATDQESLSASACDCGRSSPATLAAAHTPVTDSAPSLGVNEASGAPQARAGELVSGAARPPAPPPSPPLFLIACSFLT
jgi:hypothetical protein